MINNIDLWWLLYLGLTIIVIVIFLVIGTSYITRSKLTKLNQEKIRSAKLSERKYRSLVESIEDCILIIDNNFNIKFANAMFADKWNYKPSEIAGKNIKDLFRSEKIIKHAKIVFENGKSKKFDQKIRHNEEDYWFNIVLTLQTEDNNIQSVLFVLRDITKRKLMEIQLKDLINTLKDQQRSLSRLSKELIKVQEDERKRISRDLHDVIGQRLTAISLNLEAVKSDTFTDGELNTKIFDSSNLVKDTIRDIQDFSFSLRPTILDDLGLIPAMQVYAKRYSERTDITVDIKDEKFIEGIENDIKIVLYRIFQEGLTNIVRHANAKNVYIFFNTEEKNVKMYIVDDGIGIDLQKDRTKGLGLLGISERLAMIGGSLDFSKSEKKGTKLIVTAPYDLNE